ISEADVDTSSAAYVQELGSAEISPGVSQKPLPHTGKIKLTVRRLDSVVTEMGLGRPNVIKLDVEGAEASVLAGAGTLLAVHHPAILCEVHNTESGLEIAHKLAGMGYKLTVLGRNGPHPACLWAAPSTSPGEITTLRFALW